MAQLPIYTDPNGRLCVKCKVFKPWSAFYFSKKSNSLSGYGSRCKTCVIEDVAMNYNPVNFHRRHLKRKYKITLETWNRMLEQQDGKCAVCSEPLNKKWVNTDHDHVTGKVRALLHPYCNMLVGVVEKKTELLQKAIKYSEIYNNGCPS